MKDFVGGVFKKVYDGTFGRLSRNGKDYGQLDLNDPAVAKLFADTMKQMGIIKSTDQRNHERSHAHDSQDHGDAHGSENKAR